MNAIEILVSERLAGLDRHAPVARTVTARDPGVKAAQTRRQIEP
ncbi:hypothetical protein [Bosea sp. (in: a-proteobacteria)]